MTDTRFADFMRDSVCGYLTKNTVPRKGRVSGFSFQKPYNGHPVKFYCEIEYTGSESTTVDSVWVDTVIELSGLPTIEYFLALHFGE